METTTAWTQSGMHSNHYDRLKLKRRGMTLHHQVHSSTKVMIQVEYGKVEIKTNEIEMSIVYADEEVARHLHYVPTGALAKLRRWRADADDNVLMGSINLFRADMFALDLKETNQPFNINSIRPGPKTR